MKTIDTGITVMNECYFRSRANKGCVCVWGCGGVNTKQEILVNQWNNNDNFLRICICCVLVALLIDKVSAHTKCLHKKQFSPEHFFYIWLEVIYIWSAFHFLCKFINMCSTRCDITSWCVCVYVCVCVCVCVRVCVVFAFYAFDQKWWRFLGGSRNFSHPVCLLTI